MSEDNGADKLTPCPKKPNCVSSRATGRQWIDPSPTAKPSGSGCRLCSGNFRHPHRGAGSGLPSRRGQNPLLRFVDDLEFQYSPDEDVIHMRSASRLGYSDFGTNRKRLESIRERLEEKS